MQLNRLCSVTDIGACVVVVILMTVLLGVWTLQLTDVVSEVFRSRLVVTATRRSPSNCSFRCGRTTGHNVVIHSLRRPAR